jgi:hypothetical protein
MAIPTEPARWRRSQIAETVASSRVSAPCYRFPKDVFFVAIVESERELGKVQWQIFFAHVVIGAKHATLQERPERFHVVRVNEAANILAFAMVHGVVRKLLPACKVLIASVFISRDQFNFVFIHDSIDEPMERRHVGVFDHLADHVAFAGDRADDGNLTAGSANVLLFVPMPVGIFAAHVGFVDFDDAHQLPELRIVHRSSQAMAHIESGLVRTGTDHPMDLQGADSFLASDHQEQHPEPSSERIFGVLKNSSSDEREAISVAVPAFGVCAFPLPRLSDFVNLLALAASRTFHRIRPAARVQIFAASFLIGKHPLELRPRHLQRELRLMAIAFRLHADRIAQTILSVNSGILALLYGRGGRPHRGR